MATTVYRKPRRLPDAQECLDDLATLRVLVAEIASRYQALTDTPRATDAAHTHSPGDLYHLVRHEMEAREHESLAVVLLNSKNRVLDVQTIYHGTVNSTAVRLAEVFKPAILANAASIAIVHNHPSGDPTPSPEDVRMTAQAVAAGKLLDIEVLDHLIVGHESHQPAYVSLKERGLGF